MSEGRTWEQNIHAAPNLAFLQSVERATRIHEDFTRRGDITVTVKSFGGTRRNLHSPYDPWREAERHCQSLPSYAPVVLVFGVGAAFIPRHIIAHRHESTVIAVERDPETLRMILETIDLSRELQSRRLHLACQKHHLVKILQEVLLLAPRGMPPILELTPWVQDEANREAFRKFADVCTAVLREREGELSTMERFGVPWLGHTLRNTLTRDLGRAQGARRIVRALAGNAVTVVGAGPQVEANPLNDSLVAVDTIAPTLKVRHVVPVMIATVDTQSWSALHFRSPLVGAPVVAMDLAVPTGVHRHIPDKQCLWIGSSHPLHQLLYKAGAPITTLPVATTSVGEAAVLLTKFFGGTISNTSGLDGTAPGAKLYARGTWLSERAHREASRLVPAEHRLTALVYGDMSPLSRTNDKPTSFTKPSFRARAEAIQKIAGTWEPEGTKSHRTLSSGNSRSFDARTFWHTHAKELQTAAERLRAAGEIAVLPLATIHQLLGNDGIAQLPTALALHRRKTEEAFLLTLPETFQKISTFLFSVLNRY